MHSGKQMLNCVPCAKRKVRCDRSQPCSHCKRRKGDVCVYPAQRVNTRTTGHNASSERIGKLEAYVKHLGGDVRLLEQAGNAIPSHPQKVGCSPHHAGNVDVQGQQSADVGRTEGTVSARQGEGPHGKKEGLVEHNEQTTYTEVPMWYCWSGTKESKDEKLALLPASNRFAGPSCSTAHCFPALLDPARAVGHEDHVKPALSQAVTLVLWKTYLKNVHPLVMIFFAWEIEPIVARGAEDLSSVTPGQRALTVAISVTAISTLSDQECLAILQEKRSQALTQLQTAVEGHLLAVDFMVTSDRMVLQAFILYMLVIQFRARPAVVYSLLGIASRIAERIGLHRDGDELGIPVLRAEERRRMWWQLIQIEMATTNLVGSISMNVYANWSTKLPSNLEDNDLQLETKTLPPPRRGLTAMSHCLWRYQILHMQRVTRTPDGQMEDVAWLLSPHTSIEAKDAKIDITEQKLGEMFLQYCDPLDPLHTLIHIGIRSFVLAARRASRQPALANAKISKMSLTERNDLVQICMKSLEYYVHLQETESLRGYQWQFDVYSSFSALIYLVLEAHHRYIDDAVEEIWSLVERVYCVHPKLMVAVGNAEIEAIVRITLVAWQRRHTYLLHRYQHSQLLDPLSNFTLPVWIRQLREKIDMPETSSMPVAVNMPRDFVGAASELLPFDFDFDAMDWSFWQDSSLARAVYDLDP